ncbi:MAG: TetR/AcrR family transcriptional regulator [Acidobacteriota bacterium]
MARLAASRTADKLVAPASRGESSKHDTILRAAITVFARNGYFNSKVSDVAREAGVADGTVYLYFKSKDDLLFSIITEMLDSFIGQVRMAIAPLSSPLAQLREIARLHLEMLGRDRDLAVVFEVEIRHSTKFMEEFSTKKLSEYLDLIQQVIEAGQQAGDFRPNINPRIATKVFFGALDEMVTNWIISRRGKPLAAAVEPVLDILLHGFVPNPVLALTSPTKE